MSRRFLLFKAKILLCTHLCVKSPVLRKREISDFRSPTRKNKISKFTLFNPMSWSTEVDFSYLNFLELTNLQFWSFSIFLVVFLLHRKKKVLMHHLTRLWTILASLKLKMSTGESMHGYTDLSSIYHSICFILVLLVTERSKKKEKHKIRYINDTRKCLQ